MAQRIVRAVACLGLLSVGSALVATDSSLRSSAPKLNLRQTVPGTSSLLTAREQVGAQLRLSGGHGAPSKGEQGSGTPLELLICVSGIYFCYLYYGVLQEDLMTSKYGGKSFQEVCSLLFVVAMQCLIGAAFARISCASKPQPVTGWQKTEDFDGFKDKLWPMYMQVGFCYVTAMLLSNSALFFINYPTQVIVKSCKMIPVMAVSVLVRGKSYPMAAYVRVAMVTVGIICFTFFKKAAKLSKSGRQNSIFGLSLALASLCMDGFVGPTQEEIFSKYNSSTHQMMYYTNMWAMVLLSVAMVLTGDGARALGFVAKNPSVLSKILQFGLMSAIGQFFIFFLVRSFSALTLVTVTTTRKFFTVLASVFWFKHKLTLGQWLSVAFVFSGLAWEEASKYIAKQRKKLGARESAPPPPPLEAAKAAEPAGDAPSSPTPADPTPPAAATTPAAEPPAATEEEEAPVVTPASETETTPTKVAESAQAEDAAPVAETTADKEVEAPPA